MAKRKRKRSRSKTTSRGGGWLPRVVLGLVLIVLGVAGGYVWRSYAPLPVPEGTPLAGDAAADADPEVVTVEVEVPVEDPLLIRRAESSERRAAEAERELAQLERQLEQLRANQRQTEEQLADIQIKDVLGE